LRGSTTAGAILQAIEHLVKPALKIGALGAVAAQGQSLLVGPGGRPGPAGSAPQVGARGVKGIVTGDGVMPASASWSAAIWRQSVASAVAAAAWPGRVDVRG
jgi:hypothetical protein